MVRNYAATSFVSVPYWKIANMRQTE